MYFLPSGSGERKLLDWRSGNSSQWSSNRGRWFWLRESEKQLLQNSQVGKVAIEEDVEIGANSTVDRATLGVTRIQALVLRLTIWL